MQKIKYLNLYNEVINELNYLESEISCDLYNLFRNLMCSAEDIHTFLKRFWKKEY